MIHSVLAVLFIRHVQLRQTTVIDSYRHPFNGVQSYESVMCPLSKEANMKRQTTERRQSQ